MMKRLALVVVAMFLSACGGSDTANAPDYTSNFVGNWSGMLTITVDGQSQSPQSYVATVTVGAAKNTVDFAGSCALQGTADSATHVTVIPKTCPSQTSGACTTAVNVAAGSFTRNGSNAVLLYSGTITISGPSTCSPGTYTYSGTTNSLTKV